MNYEEVVDMGSTFIRLVGDGVTLVIPADPANSDYQAYLAELEKEKEDN